MTPALREMESKELDGFYDEVEAFAAKLDVKQQRPAAVSTMRLLGQLGRPQARRWLFKYIGAEQPSGRARPCFGRRCCVVCASRSCAKTSTPNYCRYLKKPSTPR